MFEIGIVTTEAQDFSQAKSPLNIKIAKRFAQLF